MIYWRVYSRHYFTWFVILRKLMSLKCRYLNNIEKFVALTQKSTSTGGQLLTKCFLSIELSFQFHVPRHASLSAFKSSLLKSNQLTSSGPGNRIEKEGGPSYTGGWRPRLLQTDAQDRTTQGRGQPPSNTAWGRSAKLHSGAAFRVSR